MRPIILTAVFLFLAGCAKQENVTPELSAPQSVAEKPKPNLIRIKVIYFSDDDLYSAQADHNDCTYVFNAPTAAAALEGIKHSIKIGDYLYCQHDRKATDRKLKTIQIIEYDPNK